MNEALKNFNQYFWYGETDFRMFFDCPYRLDGGFVFLCTAGEAVLCYGVDKHHIVKNAESIVLPGTTFYMETASEDFKVQLFTFSKELYDKVSLGLGLSFSLFLREVPYSVHKEGHWVMKSSRVWFDMAETVSKDTGNKFLPLLQRNYLQSYLMYLYERIRSHLDSISFKFARKQELFHKFTSLLHKHSHEQRDVSFYAEKLHITPRYLWTITRESTSLESPKELIDKYFILEIKVLLQTLELSCSEIAYKLDFPNESYFSRYFKRHTGMSPTEYRNKMSYVR
jgi:AraC-like DNA-binding protein